MKASSLPAVAVLSPTGSSTGAAFGGVIVANAAISEADKRPVVQEDVVHRTLQHAERTVRLRTDAQRQVVGRDRGRAGDVAASCTPFTYSRIVVPS